MVSTIAPLVALTLGLLSSTLVVSAHVQNDIPQKVTDKPGVVYGQGTSPSDGKPHRISAEGLDSISEIVTVKMPPPPGISTLDWLGHYYVDTQMITGKSFAMVIGDKLTFKDRSVTRYISLYLEVKPKADPKKIGTVVMKIRDALLLPQHMTECIRLAKVWNTPEGKAESYPRTAEVGILTLDDESPPVSYLTLLVYQSNKNSPAEVYFKSSKNNVTVSTNRLGDVDILRRQVRRVQAWLENRPYIP